MNIEEARDKIRAELNVDRREFVSIIGSDKRIGSSNSILSSGRKNNKGRVSWASTVGSKSPGSSDNTSKDAPSDEWEMNEARLTRLIDKRIAASSTPKSSIGSDNTNNNNEITISDKVIETIIQKVTQVCITELTRIMENSSIKKIV